ncbi:unnamed protein product, partial [Mycena citricolor]
MAHDFLQSFYTRKRRLRRHSALLSDIKINSNF